MYYILAGLFVIILIIATETIRKNYSYRARQLVRLCKTIQIKINTLSTVESGSSVMLKDIGEAIILLERLQPTIYSIAFSFKKRRLSLSHLEDYINALEEVSHTLRDFNVYRLPSELLEVKNALYTGIDESKFSIKPKSEKQLSILKEAREILDIIIPMIAVGNNGLSKRLYASALSTLAKLQNFNVFA